MSACEQINIETLNGEVESRETTTKIIVYFGVFYGGGNITFVSQTIENAHVPRTLYQSSFQNLEFSWMQQRSLADFEFERLRHFVNGNYGKVYVLRFSLLLMAG